jgi:hypothetical protein
VIVHISFLYVYICTSSLSDLPVSQIQYRFRACKSRHVVVVPTWEKRGSPHFSNNPLTYWNGASKFYKPLALSIVDNVVLLLFTFWAAHPLQPAPSKSNCEMLCRRHLKFEPTLLNVFFQQIPGTCAFVTFPTCVSSAFSQRQGISSTRS